MKHFPALPLCFVLFASITLCKSQQPVSAQQYYQAEKKEWRFVRVRNVRPDILAYLIDPDHQKTPPEFQQHSPVFPEHYKRKMFTDPFAPFTPNQTFGALITPDDSSNVLWILSTQKSFDQAKRLIDFLDKPIAQVECELEVVKINDEDIETIPKGTFSYRLSTPTKNSPYKLSVISDDSKVTLDKLVAQGKATILNAPRITVMDHLTSSLGSSMTSPITLGVKNAKGGYDPLIDTPDKGHQIGLCKSFRVSVTPSILSGTLLDINLDVSVNEILCRMTNGGTSTKDALWIRNQIDPPLNVNLLLHDNQTVIITGLTAAAVGFGSKNDNIALFFTTRIMHRSE